jgi:hypothetical protein
VLVVEMVEVVTQALDECIRREPPLAVGQHLLVHPPVARRRSRNSARAGLEDGLGLATTGVGDAREQRAVVALVGFEAVEHIEIEATAELSEHPPHRAPLGNGRDDGIGVLRSRRECGSLDHREIGALELRGCRQHVRRERDQLVVEDVGHGEHVETAECARGALRIGERGQRVAAEDQQRAQVAGLDLVDHRRARVLPGPARQVGSAGR